jgi:hypothetical protein
MHRLSTPVLVLAVALCVPAHAGNDEASPSADSRSNVHDRKMASAKTARSPSVRTDETAAIVTSGTVQSKQIVTASRVLVGRADCEFNQTVSVTRVDGAPGHFNVSFKNQNYPMVPEETTTGAVRLADPQSGMIWLQIPAKSMLLNRKTGQRIVDECVHAEQRASAESV